MKTIEAMNKFVCDPVIQLPSREGKSIRMAVIYVINDVLLCPKLADKYKYKWGGDLPTLLGFGKTMIP